MIRKTFQMLKKKENSGRRIGIFRMLCAVFGGFLLSNLGMTLFALILPFKTGNSAVLALLFTTLIYSMCAIWIVLSSSKLIALVRVLAPCLVFCISICILY